MKVSCPSCQTHYNIDEKRIPSGGAKLKCAKCKNMFPVKVGPAAEPAPPPVSNAVPLPGAAPKPELWDFETTRVGDFTKLPKDALPAEDPTQAGPVPLPGAARLPPLLDQEGPTAVAVAVPLPGAAAKAIPLPGVAPKGLDEDPWGAEPKTVAVPLPGSVRAGETASADLPVGGIPLPGLSAEEPSFADAIPLPGASAEAPSSAAVALPGANFEEPPFADAIPLPGVDSEEPPFADAIPLPGADFVAPTAAGAIPLPGADFDAPSAGAIPLPGADFDAPSAGAIPLPGADFDAPPAATLPNISAASAESFVGWEAPPTTVNAPSGGGDFETDFSVVSPGAPAPAAEAPAAAPPSFDFDDFGAPPPPAPAQASSEVDFSDVSEAPPPPAMDFGSFDPPAAEQRAPAPPPPEEDAFAVDFSSPPAPSPSAQPSDDLAFDFGSPPPPPAPKSAPAPEELEFDPTRPAPKDELEADFSAPPRPAVPDQAADGLEMLDFIDDAAKEAKASPARPKDDRYHVRRRSGKVFGPFDEGVVVKMLEDGQLLGNEDVSTDQEHWSPIGTVSKFQQVIERLMEGPTATNASPAPASMAHGEDSADKQAVKNAASMERLKNLYEGRMAAVSVVSKDSESADTGFDLRKKLPLIAAASVAFILLVTGVALGLTTPYGYFGLKLLFPAKLAAGTPEFADTQRAQAALLADTYKSYQEARDAAASALKVKEYPEARAVWSQAIYYLQRRYAAATKDELAKATEQEKSLTLLGDKHLEVLKAKAGKALASGSVPEALQILDEAAARAENKKDLELAFLRAEAYAAKGQSKLATDTLKQVLAAKADSAKALHALGNLYQREKDADSAVKAYDAALKADPNHVSSAVELAAIELLIRGNSSAGLSALEKALEAERRPLLGPAELARAAALKAEVLARQHEEEQAVAQFSEALKLDPGSTFAKAGLGRVHLTLRQYEKALPLLKEAADKEPQSIEYTDGYLAALIATGKMSDALTQVEQANARFPGNARIAFLYGRVADALDQTKDAESNYLRAVSADPEMVEGYIYLARMYLRFRRYADARTQLEAAEKKAPTHPSVLAGLGELLLVDGKIEEAKAKFEAAAAGAPNLAEAYLGLSRVAQAQDQLDKAKEHAEKALQLDPRLDGGRLQKGLVLWKLGKLEEAVAELEQAKADDPKSSNILINLGAVKIAKNDLSGAEGNLLAAVDQDPSNPEAHFHLARIKNKRSEHTQAIERMKKALDYAPKKPEYHFAMGNILKDARKATDAIEEWKQAIALNPLYADAHEALGQAYLDRGDFDDATKEFEAALVADPQRFRVLALVGDCFFQAAKWNEAVARYQKALQADAGLTQVYYRLARAYTEKGQTSEAINWYRKAASAEQTNPMPWYYLGYAFKDRGLKKDAIDAFQNYLAKKPNAEDKREIEDEIYDLKNLK